VRESRMLGCVRGALSNGCSYRDPQNADPKMDHKMLTPKCLSARLTSLAGAAVPACQQPNAGPVPPGFLQAVCRTSNWRRTWLLPLGDPLLVSAMMR
jgi:hypothetical protein